MHTFDVSIKVFERAAEGRHTDVKLQIRVAYNLAKTVIFLKIRRVSLGSLFLK